MLVKILIVAIIIYIKSIFAATETAFTYLRKAKIDHESKSRRNNKKAKRIKELLENKNKLFSSTKIGMTLAELLASAFVAEAFVNQWVKQLEIYPINTTLKYTITVIMTTIILSYFTLLFGELIPKRLARNNPEKIAYKNANKIYYMSKVTYFFEKLLTSSENLFMKLFGIGKEPPEKLTEREIKLIISEGKDQGIYDNEEKQLLYNALKFDELKIKDIMLPREKIVGINIEKEPEEILKEIGKTKYSRIPVYKNTKDNILGVLNVKDIIIKQIEENKKEIEIKDILREPIYVNKEQYVHTVFQELTLNKKHMAIVKENEKVIGLLTMEDIFERLVGKIEDEYEEER